MARYRTLYKEMKTKYADLFAEFKVVHDKYETNNAKYRDEFNEVGERFSEIVNKYIDDLCRTSEGAGFNMNSKSLPEKFKSLLLKDFPSYEDVGVTVE